MTKRFPILLLLVVFTTSFLFAQSRNVKVDKVQIVDLEFHPVVLDEAFKANHPTNSPAYGPGDAMVVTGYDYETNNTTRRMLDLVDIDGDGALDPIMVAMKRDVEGGDRFIMFAYKAFGVVDIFNAFDPSQTPFGWPPKYNILWEVLKTAQLWLWVTLAERPGILG